MTRTTGVIFSPVLGRTFFLPGFGASSLTEDEDDFNEELDVDVEFDVEPELVEDDELDEELELDEEVELGVGGVCSFSPNPSPDPDSNLTSRVKLRGAGKLVAVHVSVL